MWQRKFIRFWLVIKNIIGKLWTTIVKSKVMQQRKLIRYLLLPIGIIGIPAIIIVVPLSYTPDTSVAFPYIPPPPKGHYIETSPFDLMFFQAGSNELFAEPFLPAPSLEIYKGEAFIFKNVLITIYAVVTRKIQPYILGEGLADLETETFLMSGNVQFVPQDPSDLKKLKAGDVVDIIGVCDGMSKEWPNIFVLKNCQFMPAGIAPLPLPGGPAVVISGY